MWYVFTYIFVQLVPTRIASLLFDKSVQIVLAQEIIMMQKVKLTRCASKNSVLCRETENWVLDIRCFLRIETL